MSPAFTITSLGPEPDGATPLHEEELEQLIPDFVATRADLNTVESANILKAVPWASNQARLHGPDAIFEYGFAFELHRRMFGDVWRWAGRQRRLVTNLGCAPEHITSEMTVTLDDLRYWHHNAVFVSDEIACRAHRRLVKTHPFPNGNGRHTRLMADLYLISIGREPFTWGAGANLSETTTMRRTYLDALIEADGDDYRPLIMFARS